MCYEAVVNHYQVNSYWERSIDEGEYSLEATDLSHNLIMKYNLLKNNFKPVLLGGGFMSQHLKVKKNGFMEQDYIEEIYPEHAYFGFLIGIGMSIEIEHKEYALKFLYRKGFDNFGYFKTDDFTFSFSIPLFNFKL